MRTETKFPRVGPAAGHYESLYLKAARPGGGMAVWIRYTVHKRPNAAATASLWATLFDADGAAPLAAKSTFPGDALAVPPDAWIRIADAQLGPGRARGAFTDTHAGGATIRTAWDLAFADGAPAFRHLPWDSLYRARLPRTKLLSPHPRTTVSGSFGIGDRSIDLRDWPAMIGHNWGTEHAERWIWIEAADLEGTTDFIDIAAGRIALGPVTTPWIANGVISVDGEPSRLGGFARIGRTRIKESPTACEFSIAGRGIHVRGRVTSRPRQTVGWIYADPMGGEHNTLNCSIADLELTVERGGRERAFRALGTAAYEIGLREQDHGVPVQPHSDG
jgi:hypothetical protein